MAAIKSKTQVLTDALMMDCHGINVPELMNSKVIGNETCFFSLLQSYTDRLYYYYIEEENALQNKKIELEQLARGYSSHKKPAACNSNRSLGRRGTFFSSTTPSARRRVLRMLARLKYNEKESKSENNSTRMVPRRSIIGFLGSKANEEYLREIPKVLNELDKLKTRVKNLEIFLEGNKKAHKDILDRYCCEHNIDTIYDEEIEELLKTHHFWEGQNLRNLKDSIEDFTLSLSLENNPEFAQCSKEMRNPSIEHFPSSPRAAKKSRRSSSKKLLTNLWRTLKSQKGE